MIDYIDYKSCEGVNGVKFGASLEDIIAVFGEPNKVLEDNDDTIVMYHGLHISITLNEKEGFYYFGIGSRCPLEIKINNLRVGWTFEDIIPIICKSKNVVEGSGFITLLDLCVAFVDFYEGDEWDSEKTIVFAKKGYFEQSTQNDQPFVFEKENPCEKSIN